MPRFFVHVRGICQELSRDEFGLDFPDVQTAFITVFHAAQDMRAAFAVSGRNPQNYTVEVVNTAGERVFELPFSEVLHQKVVRRPFLDS